MDKEQYIKIYDWMLGLDLTHSELLIYATIYGFSSEGGSFTSSSKYLSSLLHMERRMTKRLITGLYEKGFLIRQKSQRDGRCYDYKAVRNRCQNNPEIRVKITPISGSKWHPYIKEDKKEDIKEKSPEQRLLELYKSRYKTFDQYMAEKRERKQS